jgi:hypothetical protein
VLLQSADLASNSGARVGEKEQGDAGDRMVAAPPLIGRRSGGTGDERRRPGQRHAGAELEGEGKRTEGTGRCSGSP